MHIRIYMYQTYNLQKYTLAQIFVVMTQTVSPPQTDMLKP